MLSRPFRGNRQAKCSLLPDQVSSISLYYLSCVLYLLAQTSQPQPDSELCKLTLPPISIDDELEYKISKVLDLKLDYCKKTPPSLLHLLDRI